LASRRRNSRLLEAFRYAGSLAASSLRAGPRDWAQVYRSTPGEQIPWCYPEIDPDLARAIDRYALRGNALDIGSGPGTQAIAFAEFGFDTTGMDISPGSRSRPKA
jgi:SAM-dependent methyltransferase